jgi:aryl-alcohol dehydrogenase-like predicted oxidoreductase
VSSFANLGLGCWSFGGDLQHDQDRSDSIKTIHAALRSGITHFDTAQGYGKGRSEQILGQQLRRFRTSNPRESLTIATKLYLPDDSRDLEGLVRRSLNRLCTPHIDILYIHWPDSRKDLEPYLIELKRLQRLGLFAKMGVSNFTAPLLEKALLITDIPYCQIPLSLMWKRSFASLAPMCNANDISLVGYSPLGVGLLTGRHRSLGQLASHDVRRRLYVYREPYHKHFLELLDVIETMAKEQGMSPASLSLLWARMQPVHTILTGARTKEQLNDAVMTGNMRLEDKDLALLEAASTTLMHMVPEEEDNPFFHRW